MKVTHIYEVAHFCSNPNDVMLLNIWNFFAHDKTGVLRCFLNILQKTVEAFGKAWVISPMFNIVHTCGFIYLVYVFTHKCISMWIEIYQSFIFIWYAGYECGTSAWCNYWILFPLSTSTKTENMNPPYVNKEYWMCIYLMQEKMSF